jgi:hypothetical protein
MMRILAIAHLTMLAAVRTQWAWCVGAGLLLIGILLPLSVKGDGSLVGWFQVALQYSLALSGILLGVATVWLACGSVSQELEHKQLRWVLTKPVQTWELWLGKWLGLVAINAVALALAGAVTGAVLTHGVKRTGWTVEDRESFRRTAWTARLVVPEVVPDWEPDIQKEVDRLYREGMVPPGEPGWRVRAETRKQVLTRFYTVAPGSERTWLFQLPTRLRVDGRWPAVQFRARGFLPGGERHGEGRWLIGAPEGMNGHTCPGVFSGFGEQVIPVPLEGLPDDGRLAVTFRNAGRDRSAVVSFDPQDGIRVLVEAGCPVWNLVKGLLVVLFTLSALAALGLSLGSLFTFPVAVFCAGCVVLALNLTHLLVAVQATEGEVVESPSRVIRVLVRGSDALVSAMRLVSEPLLAFDPVSRVSKGLQVEGGMVARAFGVMVLGTGGLLCLGSVWVLRRREIGETG